jgi:hypothetical protein
MLLPVTLVLDRVFRRQCRRVLVASMALACGLFAAAADAQVIMYGAPQPVVSYYAPMAAGYPGGYIANYSPAGNYAAVTAFSPPVATGYVANYPVTQVANYAAVEPVAAPVAVTSYYAPAAPVYTAPVTSYYAPVAVPLYRRGPFGGLRPVRWGGYIPY